MAMVAHQLFVLQRGDLPFCKSDFALLWLLYSPLTRTR